MTQFRKVIILCPHAAVVESAYTADLKSAPKGYGFKSRQRHHVRRTQLRSVSAVCVRAAKTAHPLSPSSFPKRESHGGLPFRFETPALYPLPRSSFQKRGCMSASLLCFIPPPNIVKTLFAVSISAPPFAPFQREDVLQLRVGFAGGS